MATRKKNNAVLATEDVPIRDLKPHPQNPRIGDVSLVAESLEKYGQYRAIIVNKKNNTIVAGHHTWLAARKLGWEKIQVAWINVDEVTHRKIMLMDNKSSAVGSYDELILAEIVGSLPDTEGIGYDQDEIDELIETNNEIAQAVQADVERAAAQTVEEVQELERRNSFADSDLGAERQEAVEKAKESLPGSFNLKLMQEMEFFTEPGLPPWGLPLLRNDMFMQFEDINDNLETWGGSATKDWEVPNQQWFYNWGIDSTSGMKDISNVIIAFYCWDHYFESWWDKPEVFSAKALNSGIKYICTPNFSQWGNRPRAVNLYELYRSRSLGRYFQEVGLKICVDVTWPWGDLEYQEKFVLNSLPKNIPLISMEVQTESELLVDKLAIQQYQKVFDVVEPQGAIIYAGKPGREWFEKNIVPGCPVKIIGTRNEKLGERAKQKQAKTTN
jgi:hypothetical protein